MNDAVTDQPRALAKTAATPRNTLLDSRQHWRDLVIMAAALAYETDPEGRFGFTRPSPRSGGSRPH